MPPGALDDDEVNVLLAPLNSFRSVLIAVSGGADSTALLYLTARWSWRSRAPVPRLVAVTVDHGLRAESAREAAQVAQVAEKLGIEHRIARWTAVRPKSGIQAAARRARYGILYNMATDLADGPVSENVAIVTAHTADDQAETLLMRLARGSGVDGLASISPISCRRHPDYPEREPCTLVRPLLGVPRARLLETVVAAGLPYVDDPSNTDTRFERVRVRRALRVLADHGFTTAALGRTAIRMQRAKEALERATDELEGRAVRLHVGVVHEIAGDLMAAAPPEIAVRLLRRILSRAGGNAPPADLGAIEDAVERTKRPDGAARAFTLGGCLVEPAEEAGVGGQLLRVYREPDREGGLQPNLLVPGDVLIWDGRFRASVAAGYPSPVELGPLGKDWPRLVALHPDLLSLHIPAGAARGMPAFRQAGKIVAVPLLAEACRKNGLIAVASVLSGPIQDEATGHPAGAAPAFTLTPLECETRGLAQEE